MLEYVKSLFLTCYPEFAGKIYPLTIHFIALGSIFSQYFKVSSNRVNMVWMNAPGATWSTRRLRICVCIGEVIVFGHILMTLNTTQYLMPFYRACLIPTQSSFLFTLDRKTRDPIDVLRNINLSLMFAYILITTVCNIMVATLVKIRARQVQAVQSNIQFRVSTEFKLEYDKLQ